MAQGVGLGLFSQRSPLKSGASHLEPQSVAHLSGESVGSRVSEPGVERERQLNRACSAFGLRELPTYNCTGHTALNSLAIKGCAGHAYLDRLAVGVNTPRHRDLALHLGVSKQFFLVAILDAALAGGDDAKNILLFAEAADVDLAAADTSFKTPLLFAAGTRLGAATTAGVDTTHLANSTEALSTAVACAAQTHTMTNDEFVVIAAHGRIELVLKASFFAEDVLQRPMPHTLCCEVFLDAEFGDPSGRFAILRPALALDEHPVGANVQRAVRSRVGARRSEYLQVDLAVPHVVGTSVLENASLAWCLRTGALGQCCDQSHYDERFHLSLPWIPGHR